MHSLEEEIAYNGGPLTTRNRACSRLQTSVSLAAAAVKTNITGQRIEEYKQNKTAASHPPLQQMVSEY